MLTTRGLIAIAAIALVSCAGIETGKPYVDGKVQSVSASDIQAAIAAARKGILGAHPSGPAYRVHVVSANEVEVYFGEHYGTAAPAGQSYFSVKRVNGKWQVWDFILGG